MKETFYYARVSSKDQNEARQIAQFESLGADRAHIFTETASGRSMDRPKWNELKERLQEGDTVVFASLDRMGRDYRQIRATWQELTASGVSIHVLDMPVLNTDRTDISGAGLTGVFISEIVLNVLAFVAQTERENTRRRQREGINAMPIDSATGKRMSTKTGNTTGRPRNEMPENYDTVMTEWKAGTITAKEAMERTGLKRGTFYNRIKEGAEHD